MPIDRRVPNAPVRPLTAPSDTADDLVNASAPELRHIAAAPPLELAYLPGRGDTLVLSLAGVGKKRSQPPPPEFYKIASQNGENHVLFVSDVSRSWMNAPGLAEQLVAAIETAADQAAARRIVALGNSMGATMALLLAGLTRLDTVIALVPQFSVHPVLVPEEKRWTFFRNRITDWPFEAITRLHTDTTETIILHGGTADERVHLDRFPKDPKCRHFVFPDMDHRLAARLHRQGKLDRIIRYALAAQHVKLRRAIEKAGGLPRRAFDRQRRHDASNA